MGFSLRNMLHEAVAQVNPFDGGQTAHTVAQQHPTFTPATPATNNFQRAWDQVNPFDNGRTWQHSDPTTAPGAQPLSVIHQITHNGLTNAGGDIVHSVTNVGAAPVFMLRGMASQFLTHDQNAAQSDYEQAMKDARNNLVTGLGEQAANSVKGFILDPAVSLLTPDGSVAHQIAEDQTMQDLNKTPFGQLWDPVQHKAAEYQVHRDLPNLNKDQQKQVIAANETQAGLDPNASLGKQGLTSGLAALQLATADKVANGVPIKEDIANKAAATQAAVPKIIQAAQDSKVPQIISSAKNAVADTTHDIVTGKPYRNITDEELAGAARVRAANQGMGDPMNLTDQDMAHYYSVMKKAGGTTGNDIKAVDDVLGARQTYNTRQDYMNSPEVKQGGYIKNPFADPNNTDSLIEKGKQSLGKLDKAMAENDRLMKDQEPITAYHGSTNDKLTTLSPGSKTGLNEKRNLIYLSENSDAAANYAKNRGAGGLGKLSDSATGKVYPVEVHGKILDAYDHTGLAELKNALGYEQLSGKIKNILSNDTGLSSDQLEANPELTKFLSDNGITAVRSHLPNGNPKDTELAVVNHQKIAIKDLQPGDQAAQAAEKITKPKATGIVDKQLQQIEKAKKDVINYTANEIREASKPQAGGIREQMGRNSVYVGKDGLPEDYQSLPNHMRSTDPNKQSLDEWATSLGFDNENDLLDAIANNKTGKGMSKAEALAEAEKQLEAGKHPYSADYQQIKDALAKRQDELSLYPKGTRAQVKVDTKAPKMSDEELASLSQQPEAQVKPAGNKIVKVDDKNEIRNADAERQVIEDLKGNKGTDTAIENYMKATGATLQKAVHDINRVAREADLHTDLGKNPIEGKVLLPKVDEGNWKQATLNARFVQSKELELGGKALDSYHALSPHDQVLLKDIETNTVRQVAKKADDPAAFKQAESDIRNYYDHRHAYDRALGIDVGYRTNYLRQLFDRVEEEKNATGDEQLRGGGGNKNPAYTKERTFDTLGADVGNALERDIKGSSFNHAKLTYEQGLNEAFPGKIANGEIPRSTNSGVYQQLDHPFGNDLSAPKDIAHEINSRVWHQNDSKALDVYDKLNHGFKYVKLSGGLFHAFTESGNFIGQQLASGKLITDPAAAGRLAKVFFSQKAMDNELTRMADHGVLDKAHLAGLTTTPREILADANVSALDKAGNKITKMTGIQQMHDATFKREIPYAKLKIFEQKTEGLDPMKPADLAKMRTQAEAINNLFGGINREVQGMKPGTFKWVQRALLATDFTEGKWVTLAKALSDKGEAGTLARQAVVGKALVFGLIATAGAALGGDYQGKSKGQIAKDAAGNLLDPSFEMGGYKVGLPKTHISEAVDAFKPTNKNGKAWNASGVTTYLQDRSAALPSEAIQLLSNKNYYGQPLYGTNTKKNGGGKISAPQAASNIAQTVLPIPVGQAATTAQGKQNPAAAVANVVGFKAKPNPANSVSFQGQQTQLSDKQTEQYTGQLNSTMKSAQQQLQSSSAYKNANPNDQAKMMSDLKKNVDSAVQRDFASKNNVGQFAPDFTGKGTQATTKESDILSGKINPDAYVPNSGNNDSYAVSQFKKSNKQVTTIGNDTYYKTSDGTVKHQATFDYNIGIDNAKADFALDRAKASDNYAGWATAAQTKYDLIQKQIDHLNPNSQQADIIKLRKQQADLIDTAQKYASYGGFTKPKSGSSRVSQLEKNSFTYKVPKSTNDSLRSMLAAARISAPGSSRRFKATQVVKVA